MEEAQIQSACGKNHKKQGEKRIFAGLCRGKHEPCIFMGIKLPVCFKILSDSGNMDVRVHKFLDFFVLAVKPLTELVVVE